MAARNTRTRGYAAEGIRRNSAGYYVEGTAVRDLRTMPRQQRPYVVSDRARQNRERALSMNLRYVAFLTAAGVMTVLMCVNYLKLQSKRIKLNREVTVLESSLNAARLENDADYNRIMTGINMEHVKDVAMHELGMVYVGKSQIVTYTQDDNDYVHQYTDVPG